MAWCRQSVLSTWLEQWLVAEWQYVNQELSKTISTQYNLILRATYVDIVYAGIAAMYSVVKGNRDILILGS